MLCLPNFLEANPSTAFHLFPDFSPRYCPHFITSLSPSTEPFLAAYKHALVISMFKKSSLLPPSTLQPYLFLCSHSHQDFCKDWPGRDVFLPFPSHSVSRSFLSSFWPVTLLHLVWSTVPALASLQPLPITVTKFIHPPPVATRTLLKYKPIHVH